MELISTEIFSLALGIAYLIAGVMVLVIARYVLDWLTPYNLDEELTEKDNPALGLPVAGYFIAVVIIFLGAAFGPELESDLGGLDLLLVVGIDVAYALAGILALNLARLSVDKLVLTQFDTKKEIIEDRNVGTGAVEAGSYIGSSLIIAGAIHGEGGGPLTALVFFLLGQLALILFARFYQLITSYDLHAEIERDNVAAGVAMGMSMIAISIIVFKGTVAEFESWSENLTWFGIEILLGFLLLYGLRKLTDLVFLPGSSLDYEIANDQNLNAAWVEGAIANGFAVMIFFLL